jgi:hypothetical protein
MKDLTVRNIGIPNKNISITSDDRNGYLENAAIIRNTNKRTDEVIANRTKLTKFKMNARRRSFSS